MALSTMFVNSYRIQLANEDLVAVLFEALEDFTEDAPLSKLFYHVCTLLLMSHK